MNESLLVKQFSEIYYQNASEAELPPAGREARARRHLQLLQRLLREPLVEVSADEANPQRAQLMLVTPDRPFLIDSLRMDLDEQGIALHQLIHSVMALDRDSSGNIVSINPVNEGTRSDEKVSVIYGEIDRTADLNAVAEHIRAKIKVLNLIADDFPLMRTRLQEVRNQLNAMRLPAASAYNLAQVGSFLDWLLDDHFTFLGFRAYDFKNGQLFTVADSGLGLMRQEGPGQLSSSFNELPESLRAQLQEPEILLFSKSNHIAPVHRPVYMDFIGIQRYNAQGELIGEWRLLGLFTASAYQLPVQQIPLLREKAEQILERAHYPAGGYGDKRLRFLLNEFPRDELFQASVNQLVPVFRAVVGLVDTQRLRLFTRVDHYQRFVSALVYVPRDKFNTENREKIQSLLVLGYEGGRSEFTPHFSNQFVRVAFHIRTQPGHVPSLDPAMLEEALNNVIRDWNDDFNALTDNSQYRQIARALPNGYRDSFSPEAALRDVQIWAELGSDSTPRVLLSALDREKSRLQVRLLGVGPEYQPSDVLPLIEHFGLRVEHLSSFRSGEGQWLQDYELSFAGNLEHSDGDRFTSALQAALAGASSDRFNQLILSTRLNSQQVLVLRALSRYMQQASVPFSTDYIQRAVNNNPAIAEALLHVFAVKFDPAQKDRQFQLSQAESALQTALAAVVSLDEDRILRWLAVLLQAMVRTNFYQDNDGLPLAFKFSARDIPDLPEPKPLFEIFVYADDVEGVHLRGGKVARGGIRWSDRMDDYRTEVLGLVKAQMVKNTIIVPVGSKGGFIVKKPSASREEFLQLGQACYKRYISALLSLTDNLINHNVVPPKNVVRHDADDPYLVVAADKGTASFSNLANGISAQFNFWLGDAFASGGSAGYDHKGMGITARGAWESVKRHFRHLGKDIQNRDEITVVGIGDMSGDVFGNGMLLSHKLQLVAAFNHLHIFIDPNPDAEKSFAERERLFRTPRSTWADYDRSLMSAGGGIFNRSDKTIAISPEMKARFDISEDQLAPSELIQRLLAAPVDLIWNGGIGTYIKHSEESNAQVGDRNNDAVRINGNQVRAKVIGEGGNLGMTQRGRIEAGLHGVRLNTDAIDNSGGVNCSDHEVNIKILLNQVFGADALNQRNELLAAMTDEVAQLVLQQNYLQPQIIELAHGEALGPQVRVMRQLEQEGLLNRALEFLPSDEALKNRDGLTRSELAVLLAYSKMWVYDHLLRSSLPDNDYFQDNLERYFPSALGQYSEAMQKHPLRREIISTYLTNDLVNHMGLSFLFRLSEESGRRPDEVALAYSVARAVFNAPSYWQQINAQDNILPADRQLDMHRQLQQLLEGATLWFLRQQEHIDVAALVQQFGAQVQALVAGGWFKGQFAVSGNDIEARFALLPHYLSALDIVLLAQQHQVPVSQVGEAYFGLLQRLHGGWFKAQIAALPSVDSWEKRARQALSAQFHQVLRDLVPQLLQQALADWEQSHAVGLQRLDSAHSELRDRSASLAVLSVLVSELKAL